MKTLAQHPRMITTAKAQDDTTGRWGYKATLNGDSIFGRIEAEAVALLLQKNTGEMAVKWSNGDIVIYVY